MQLHRRIVACLIGGVLVLGAEPVHATVCGTPVGELVGIPSAVVHAASLGGVSLALAISDDESQMAWATGITAAANLLQSGTVLATYAANGQGGPGFCDGFVGASIAVEGLSAALSTALFFYSFALRSPWERRPPVEGFLEASASGVNGGVILRL